MDYISEAEALSYIYDDVDYGDTEELRKEIKNRNTRLEKRYNLAKDKKVGETFKCAYCGKEHIKKQYSQVFCPPLKRGKSKQYKCKDKYWNSVDSSRWRNQIPENRDEYFYYTSTEY